MRFVKAMVIASLVATGGFAYAADLPVLNKAQALSPTPLYVWNNIWIGGFLGAAVDTGGINIADSSGTSLLNGLGSAPAGFLGGFDIGANFQIIPRWVVGVYAEQGFAGIHNGGGSNIAVNIDVTHSTNYIGAAGGRLGFLITDSTLLYGKGGIAWGGTKATFDAATLSQAISETSTGWQAGFGIEHRLSWAPNWSVGLEYDHVRLGEKPVTLTVDTVPVATATNQFRFEEFRLFGRYLF